MGRIYSYYKRNASPFKINREKFSFKDKKHITLSGKTKVKREGARKERFLLNH